MADDKTVDHGDIDLVEKRLHVHAPPWVGLLRSQTRQQCRLVDPDRHRRVDRGHGGRQAVSRTLRPTK
ncbi:MULTISPECIES: hypothetical protein [unclassified Bradyrhizobium]|uniref:hypothetical protein n=1 Tax=unclassified Bradyrhizobium TaxID=2631580 RepID=UPI0028E9F64F|nr:MULTISPECIES: hypothetical protein [unclassified Bradyrhizobium]